MQASTMRADPPHNPPTTSWKGGQIPPPGMWAPPWPPSLPFQPLPDSQVQHLPPSTSHLPSSTPNGNHACHRFNHRNSSNHGLLRKVQNEPARGAAEAVRQVQYHPILLARLPKGRLQDAQEDFRQARKRQPLRSLDIIWTFCFIPGVRPNRRSLGDPRGQDRPLASQGHRPARHQALYPPHEQDVAARPLREGRLPSPRRRLPAAGRRSLQCRGRGRPRQPPQRLRRRQEGLHPLPGQGRAGRQGILPGWWNADKKAECIAMGIGATSGRTSSAGWTSRTSRITTGTPSSPCSCACLPRASTDPPRGAFAATPCWQ